MRFPSMIVATFLLSLSLSRHTALLDGIEVQACVKSLATKAEVVLPHMNFTPEFDALHGFTEEVQTGNVFLKKANIDMKSSASVSVLEDSKTVAHLGEEPIGMSIYEMWTRYAFSSVSVYRPMDESAVDWFLDKSTPNRESVEIYEKSHYSTYVLLLTHRFLP